MTWQLRAASAADLESVMALETEIFAGDAWSSHIMREELASEHGHYLVAFRPESPERIEGYAGLRAPHGARDADVQTIAVAQSARRSGLGTALMRRLMAVAWQRGAREIFLEVRADNPGAQALYERLGFTAIGVRRGYYQPGNVDAIVMRVRLQEPRAQLAESGTAEESA